MFSNSWSGNQTLQDFALTSKKNSLADTLSKYVNRTIMRADGGDSRPPLDVFNSTSVSSFIAIKLLNFWSSRGADVNKMWNVPSDFLWNKLAYRRTGFATKKLNWDPRRPSFLYRTGMLLDGLRLKAWEVNPKMLKLYTPEQLRVVTAYPLRPYDNFPLAPPTYYVAAKKKVDLLRGKGMSWQTIHYGMYSEFEL